ncbi:MAG: NnrU family protein [Rubrivivax sp.]
MALLIVGLVLFLGLHSVRIVAEGWRTRTVARIGQNAWKGAYSVGSVIGLVLIVWGYGIARQTPQLLWLSPTWTRHLAALLTVPAFIGLVAAYVPRNHVKAAVGHPMVLGVLLWALAHLLANGTVADLLLFGGFAVWAAFDYGAALRRAPVSGARRAAASWGLTALTVLIGLVAWVGFAFWAHGVLIGVRPFG